MTGAAQGKGSLGWARAKAPVLWYGSRPASREGGRGGAEGPVSKGEADSKEKSLVRGPRSGDGDGGEVCGGGFFCDGFFFGVRHHLMLRGTGYLENRQIL